MRIQYLTGHRELTEDRGWQTTIFMTKSLGHEIDFVPLSACRNPFKLLRRIRSFRPDVLYVGDYLGVPLGIMNRLHLLGAPAVYFWNEYHEELYRSFLPSRFLRRMVERFMISCFDYVWSNGLYNANVARLRGKHVRYLLNASHGEELPTNVRLEDGVFNIVYVGDQSGSRKNIPLMMDTVRDEACVLTMIGNVNEKLKASAPPNVRCIGFVPPKELRSVLKQADLLINMTDTDCDVKNSDYMAAGRPVLCFRGRRGRAENVFLHRYNAYVSVDPKEGLRELMRDEELRKQLAENLSKYPILTWKQQTKLRLEYFGDVVRDWKSRR